MIRWRRKPAPPPIWNGVHASFAEIRASGAGHESQSWLDALGGELEHIRAGARDETFVLEHEALLFVLRHVRPARVVDFGGGAGQSYAYARQAIPDLSVHWTVVEVPAVAAHARTLFANDDSITFAERISGAAGVVFVKSALQYLEDWSGTLRELLALGASHVVLEKFSGVAAKTYATAQVNLGDSAVPYWFISFDELFDVAARAGYRRVLWRRLPRVYDQSNFPEELRMGQASTIVLAM